MQIESFLRGFERGLEKEAGVVGRLGAAFKGGAKGFVRGLTQGSRQPPKVVSDELVSKSGRKILDLGKGPGKPMSWLGGGPSKGVDMPPDISARLPKASPSDWMKMVNLRTGKVRP